MGRTSALAALSGPLSACSLLDKKSAANTTVPHLQPLRADDLSLAAGFSYRLLLSWGDELNSSGEKFGFNNDYINWAPVPGKDDNEIILWVNHEYVDPFLMSGWNRRSSDPRKKNDVEDEMQAVGGSLVHIKEENGIWRRVTNSPYNRRLTANTPMNIVAPRQIHNSRTAIGTLANCAGGKTPDNKILTCEENYDQFVGEVSFSEKGERTWKPGRPDLRWHEFHPRPPEHYGWVVEVDPLTGKGRKLTALGRFAHECATVTVAPDGRWVAYTGDDANDQCLYKFISSSPGQLEIGTLYVADIENGRWLPLDINVDPRLKARFKDQTDLLIQTRIAADLIGGSKLARPEDIEIDPVSGAVLIALTNNKPRGNFHGSILKIVEDNSSPTSLSFKAETFLAGGTTTGFSCPDNLAFDAQGDLWLTSDMSTKASSQKDYAAFGNNGLYYIPMSGSDSGRVFQIASAPVGAELTGPCFSPDGNTLFLSIQHPGENTLSLDAYTSHWPDGGNSQPRPSVVAIKGPLITGSKKE